MTGLPMGNSEPNKARHLRQIRTIIRRMALASLTVKLWCTLAVLTVLFVSNTAGRGHWIWLAVFLSVVFWLMDAHVLRQLRLFRKNQDRVEQLDEEQIDFDMSTRALATEREALSTVLSSPSVFGFYLVILCGIGLSAALDLGLTAPWGNAWDSARQAN